MSRDRTWRSGQLNHGLTAAAVKEDDCRQGLATLNLLKMEMRRLLLLLQWHGGQRKLTNKQCRGRRLLGTRTRREEGWIKRRWMVTDSRGSTDDIACINSDHEMINASPSKSQHDATNRRGVEKHCNDETLCAVTLIWQPARTKAIY